MNWVDFVLVGLLLVAIIIGSRRGLFSGLMGMLGLTSGIIFSVNYIDQIAAKFLSHMRVSTVMVVFMGIVVVFVMVYLCTKILGSLFYKFASLKPLGNADKMGGAVLGIFQGWTVLGVFLFLLIFLPLPRSFVDKLDTSFFAPGMRGVVPMIYDETAFLHPENPKLLDKMKTALKSKPGSSSRDWGGFSTEGPSVSRIISMMEEYFGT
jgi:uncharacterized membrane protein required for colicin V production